jgi:AraC-like DNA-binding protein
VDPLSDVLTLLDIRSAESSRLECGGRWALSFEGYQHIKVGAVLAGSAWITVAGSPPVQLITGDCYLLVGGQPYQAAGDLDTKPEDGHGVFRRATGKTVYCGDDSDSPDRTIFAGGAVTFDDTTASMLLDNLPPIVRIAGDSLAARVVRPALQLLETETTAALPGADLMSVHLTQILFIQALRAHLATGQDADEVPGWLGALRDPQIREALDLMHEDPARHWTVAELATAVGLSRSTFALKFKTLVGLSPLDYLSRWRIRSAGQTLRTGNRTVASVAAEWGYASESAFSNAFKRVTGSPPARYRTAG